MKLLILTQKIDRNDDVLGFMHRWVEAFSRQCEKVTVICLEQGVYALPENVRIISLGKEKKENREYRIGNMGNKLLQRLQYLVRFYQLAWCERNSYDAVFVHMNTEYVVLGGWLWRLLGKRVGLWYAHGYVPWSLWVAEKFAHIIFTSTKSGCRIVSKKIKVVGQGIDGEQFIHHESPGTTNSGILTLITVGRISPVKDLETLIEATAVLRDVGVHFSVRIVGGAGLPEQHAYAAALRELVAEKKLHDTVHFAGAVSHAKIAAYLQKADIFINTSRTGSLDKAVLEAMATGLPILTCNEALKEVLGGYTEQLMYQKGDAAELAKKILLLKNMDKAERRRLGEGLRKIVIEQHSVAGLITKIVSGYADGYHRD